MKKTSRILVFALICSGFSLLLTRCADGIFSLRGYIPEEGEYQEILPPAEPEAPEQHKTPDFILKILRETEVTPPPPAQKLPPPPPPPPRKKEWDPLEAS